MKSDIEIAQSVEMQSIYKVTESIGIDEKFVEPYGKHKGKINHKIIEELKDKPDAKIVLVTAISPTPAGEGKTTTTVGLGDALTKLGKKTTICLREPSLGPVFGMKGGAAGGGYAQVVPMEDINLHFTGDLHAITAANNLVAAMLDNHIFQGNVLNIDPRRVVWKRVIDMNDRQLRHIVGGIGAQVNGMPREDGFDIAVASEIMAIFCLSNTLVEFKEKVGNCIIAYTFDDQPVYIKDIKAQGAVAALIKDAFNPNVAQTLEGTPALIHGGPFANIAHGCNSVIATRLATKVADVVVTEAGFGADLGAEKFINIKCRKSGLRPDAVVLVATVRALKYQGGCKMSDLSIENADVLKKGCANLTRHIENIKEVYGVPAVVAINQFPTDTENDYKIIKDICAGLGVKVEISEVFAKGGNGGTDLAKTVLTLFDEPNNFKFTYDENLALAEKIETVAKTVYKADGVVYSAGVTAKLKKFEEMGYKNLPVCMAKTQYSFADDKELLGAAVNHKVTINDVVLNAGAGFVVAIAGKIMRMPGLPKVPSAENIDVDANGNIVGLS